MFVKTRYDAKQMCNSLHIRPSWCVNAKTQNLNPLSWLCSLQRRSRCGFETRECENDRASFHHTYYAVMDALKHRYVHLYSGETVTLAMPLLADRAHSPGMSH